KPEDERQLNRHWQTTSNDRSHEQPPLPHRVARRWGYPLRADHSATQTGPGSIGSCALPAGSAPAATRLRASSPTGRTQAPGPLPVHIAERPHRTDARIDKPPRTVSRCARRAGSDPTADTNRTEGHRPVDAVAPAVAPMVVQKAPPVVPIPALLSTRV